MCKSIIITEFAVGAKAPNGPPGRDMYFSGELGWLANVSARSAIGSTVQYGIDDESDFRVAFKPRYRHWLTDAANIDLAVGLVVWGEDLRFPGFTGHGVFNFASIGGVGIQLEAFEDEVGSSVDWYFMGRLGAEWGLGAGLLAAVVGVVVAAVSGTTS